RADSCSSTGRRLAARPSRSRPADGGATAGPLDDGTGGMTNRRGAATVLAASRPLRSPMTTTTFPPATPHATQPDGSRGVPKSLAAVALASTCIILGLLWDISWHRTIGRDAFLTPAHLAIYLGAVSAGLTCGRLALFTTFAGRPQDRATSVRFWGFRAPLGAWVCIWGSFAMLTSAPFDNWWHDAYGLDVQILSPPHSLL